MESSVRQKYHVASVALPTINTICSPIALEGPNPGLNGVKLTTNHLSYGMANTAVRAQITCPNQMLVSGYHERNLLSFSKHTLHTSLPQRELAYVGTAEQLDTGWVVEEFGYDT